VFGNKLPQSVLPGPESRPENGTVWQYAAICQNCRWHLQVRTTFRPLADRSYQYCPSELSRLHHFVLDSAAVEKDGQVNINSGMESYHFHCTNCPCGVQCRVAPPRLDDNSIELLTSQYRLEQRCEILKAEDPERKGVMPQRAIQVLEALYAYLRDSMKPSKERKRIPKANRRFRLSLGDDCEEFLKWLGFSDETDEAWWALPEIPPSNPLGEYNRRQLVEDVREELLALIRQWPDSERQGLKQISSSEWTAVVDNGLERILSSSVYDKVSATRRTLDLSGSEENAYAGLGALWDFADDLVLFAFQQQAKNDEAHAIFYFDCLLAITGKRGSESLNVAVATMASQDFISSSDVEDAYRYFTIDLRVAPSLVDEHILGIFQSRLADSPPAQEADLRRRLHIIGKARGSLALMEAAEHSEFLLVPSPSTPAMSQLQPASTLPCQRRRTLRTHASPIPTCGQKSHQHDGWRANSRYSLTPWS
jgi:ubiquitin carboxyl-terminal hydrolase 25